MRFAPRSSEQAWAILLAGACLLVSLAASGVAADPRWMLHIEIGDVAGSGWSAHGVELQMAAPLEPRTALRLTTANLQLDGLQAPIRALELVCPEAVLGPSAVRCPSGRLGFQQALTGKQQAQISFRYGHDRTRFTVNGLRLAAGAVTLQGNVTGDDWRVDLKAAQARAAQIQSLLAELVPTVLLPVQAHGDLTAHASVQGDHRGLQAMQTEIESGNLRFTNPASTLVGESLDVVLTGAGTRQGQDWRFHSGLKLRRGQLYIDPMYLGVDGKPVALHAAGRWGSTDGRMVLSRLSFRDPEVLRARGSAKIATEPALTLKQAHGRVTKGRLPKLYQTYLQPWLIDTPLAELDTRGRVTGAFDYRDGRFRQARLRIQDLDAGNNRFGISGLRATLHWGRGDARPATSHLSFEGGRVVGVALGSTGLALQLHGRDLRLVEPAQLPMFDGALAIDRFDLQGAGRPDQRLTLDAEVLPLSLKALTQSLGWPPLAGELAGRIPDVSYTDGRLAVGGALRIQAFDGSVAIKHLVARQLLGAIPQLSADVELQDLDLERITETFSFGEMQGRLEGRIKALKLVDWEPVGFDATLKTPPGEAAGRRRISQRAVDNLTRLGNGVSGALSSGLLRFFDEFGYSRLGLSCRLHNGICQMGGVEPVDDGYYIVKGAGLPRIDVIGHNERVAWNVLVDRLRNIDLQTAPVVK